jgi:hypothetical protein
MTEKSELLDVAARFADLPVGHLHPEVCRGVKIGGDYAPAVSGNWSPAPTAQDAAVDQLAARLKAAEALITSIKPSHVVVAAASVTTVGGNAVETISIPGKSITATDLVLVTIQTNSGAAVLLKAAAGTNQITVTFDIDPTTTVKLQYAVLRAA